MRHLILISVLVLAGIPRNCEDKLCEVVTCEPGYHCVKGECVKDPEPTPEPPKTCETKPCEPGYTCKDTPEGPVCIKNPDPEPTPECKVPNSNDPNWTTQEPKPPSEKRQVTLEATETIGDRCGQNPDDSLSLLANELNRKDECAGVWADSVLIKRSDGTWEQRHAVRYSDGCWLTTDGPNIYEGVWIYGDVEIPPTPSICNNPTPLLKFENGDPHYRIDSGPYGSEWADHTIVYLDVWDSSSASCPYCTAIGMGTIGNNPRCTCPTRKPGSPDEVACNDYLSGGKLVMQARNNANCIRIDDTKIVRNNENCRLCSTDSKVCGKWW